VGDEKILDVDEIFFLVPIPQRIAEQDGVYPSREKDEDNNY
jgi:hypothetical protein